MYAEAILVDINLSTGLQSLAGGRTKDLQDKCASYLSGLQGRYGISDADMGLFAALLIDYTESFVGDGYDTGMKAGIETGQEFGYHNAVADVEEALATDVVKGFAKMQLGIKE